MNLTSGSSNNALRRPRLHEPGLGHLPDSMNLTSGVALRGSRSSLQTDPTTECWPTNELIQQLEKCVAKVQDVDEVETEAARQLRELLLAEATALKCVVDVDHGEVEYICCNKVKLCPWKEFHESCWDQAGGKERWEGGGRVGVVGERWEEEGGREVGGRRTRGGGGGEVGGRRGGSGREEGRRGEMGRRRIRRRITEGDHGSICMRRVSLC